MPYPVCFSPPEINLQQWPVSTNNDLEYVAQILIRTLHVCVCGSHEDKTVL